MKMQAHQGKTKNIKMNFNGLSKQIKYPPPTKMLKLKNYTFEWANSTHLKNLGKNKTSLPLSPLSLVDRFSI